MSTLADTLRLRVLDRRCRRALAIVLALRAWQWFARPIDFWSYIPGTSGALYGYMWVTDASSAAFLLVPLLVYACAGHLEGLLDAHRLVRMRSRGWAVADFLGIAAGKALMLSVVALVSGLVIVVPQVPAETASPQLVLAFLGILARQALFFLVCAVLMLAAYALTSLVPAAAVVALAYGAVGYLLQGRLLNDTPLDRWGWLCTMPPRNVPDTADALACMAKYAVAIATLMGVAALALRRRDVLGEGGSGPGEKSSRGERHLVLWLPLRRRYLGRVCACVGAAALVAFLLSRGNPIYALARLHAGTIFLPNDLGIDLFGTVGALLPPLALAWLLASFLTSDLTHAPLLLPRLSFGDVFFRAEISGQVCGARTPKRCNARTRWALIRTGQLALLAGAYGALAPTVAAAACLLGSGDVLEDVAAALAQVLPFSVAGSVLLVLLVNLLALRLDAVIAWAVVAVAHATSLVACVFLPESAVVALTPWLPSAAATAAFHAAPIGASAPLSLAYLLLLVLLACALVVREARRLDILGGDRHD
ncbi:hypothetical protein [Thermophilibacter provencensis]|uniref:ABC-2 type transport system permease protein n=1 Tax=Thermophilibacter provencensis TaxID=1852386 RepID=A0ABT7V5C1_9ACTN|nr:hypothetical protein [Thermophilibacter provencensis]MDM8271800.1 hypothetical protein [Thermophilibacter provencensis]